MIKARLIYACCGILSMLLGLLTRTAIIDFPDFVILYVGDSLWAMMVYWGICFLKPNWPIFKQVIAALLFAYSIEFSQLYQAQWINDIRHTQIGALVLGFGFQLSDLVAYACGVFIGAILSKTVIKSAFESSH